MKGKIEIELKHIAPVVCALFFFIIYAVIMVIGAYRQGDYFTSIALGAASLWWTNVFVTILSKAQEQILKK